jgi:hypothetical protein
MNHNAHSEYLNILKELKSRSRALIAKLEAQIEVEKARYADAEKAEAIVSALAEISPSLVSSPFDNSASPNSSVSSGLTVGESHLPRKVSATKHADVAEDILRTSRKPMRIQEIIEAMEAMHQPLPAEPVKRYGAIYSALMRRPQTFEKIGRNEWTLTRRARDSDRNSAFSLQSSPSLPDSRRNVEMTNGSTVASGTRYDRIEKLLREAGGPLNTKAIIAGLIALGDRPADPTNPDRFYNVVESALRGGVNQGRFRRTGVAATWELAPGW